MTKNQTVSSGHSLAVSRVVNKSKSTKISKVAAPEFYDGKFLAASQKQGIFLDFVRFVQGGYKPAQFSKRLYQYLSIRYGFIAHFNAYGFFQERFVNTQGRAETFSRMSTAHASPWDYRDENTSGCADLNLALSRFVDAELQSILEGIRQDELRNIDICMAELLAKKERLSRGGRVDDAKTIDILAAHSDQEDMYAWNAHPAPRQ